MVPAMQVFVSYSSHDRRRVERLVRALEANRVSVFWDPEIPPATPTYNTYLADRLAEADRAVVVWTPSSVVSQWVIEEANEARRRGILVPVRLDDVEPPLGFRSMQTLDLRGWSGGATDPRIGQLLDALAGRPIRPGPPPRRRGRATAALVAALVVVLSAAAAAVWLPNDGDDDRGTTPTTQPRASPTTQPSTSPLTEPTETTIAPPPPAPELSPVQDGVQRFAEDRTSITVDPGETDLAGFDLWQASPDAQPSCADGGIRVSWQVIEPWPADAVRLELRTEIPRTDQTTVIGEGASGELYLGWCGTLMVRNLGTDPIAVELRYASEL
jgi:hypothetical protein